MSLATRVQRDQGLTLDDLDIMRQTKAGLIDMFLYEKLTPRKKNMLMHHVKEIEIWIKENSERVLKSEFAVKPIKLFPYVRDHKAEYQQVKKRKNDTNPTNSRPQVVDTS